MPLLVYGDSNLDAHRFITGERGKRLVAGSRERFTWFVAKRRTSLSVDAPPVADVGLKRRVAMAVEVTIPDLCQGIIDLYVRPDTLLCDRLKSTEVLDLGGC
ncbi:MAG TPA: hypothetical protein VMB27_13680 [Solirubrobacteraceae bacterium]|nr:hypothetical protein [Solirubrobacteraceae bacterium]